MPNQVHKNRTLTWKDTPDKLKPSNSTWSQDGVRKGISKSFNDYLENQFDDEVVFRFYDDNVNNTIILSDLINGVTYTLPSNAKSKGYVLAFKLLFKI